MEGFPSSVHGRTLFIDKDNLNTDGIYGSKHTYRDDMTPKDMAAVTFEIYDPNFNTLYQEGDVVVGGLLGTATSSLFYWYQERRFRDHEKASSVQLAPSLTGTSVGLSLSGSW